MTANSSHNFPIKQNGYAAFDAISLRNLIIDRLNEQGIITDQNYIGSNIASIIDIISFSFNTLIYYLNKTSTESLFSEAQLYENINRIVKILDYKPIGYQTSCLAFSCSADNSFAKGTYTIPKYSYITVGSIPFSFNEDVTFSISSDFTSTELTDLTNKKLLYQGTFRENPLYTAVGNENEVVIINVSNALIDHFNVHVYVKEISTGLWAEYKQVPSLYMERSLSRSFEKRLNSNLLYEITFGDDINGKKLQTGDIVAIYFLQSSGSTGVVSSNVLAGQQLYLFTTSTFESIKVDTNIETLTYLTPQSLSHLRFNNSVGSTVPKDIESAESIRKNAPLTFKSQNRLVTLEDYKNFIQTNHGSFLSDVNMFDNWDYTGKYLKYFYDIGTSPGQFQQIMFNQVMFADSCNFNNIYICATPRISQGSTLKYLLPAQKELISSSIQPLKTATAEITFLDPLYKAISFGIKNIYGNIALERLDEFVFEVVKKASNQRSAKSVQREVSNLFKTFFDPATIKLGTLLDHVTLVSKLLSINGVSKIRTKNLNTQETFEGLSFYMWNPSFPDYDKQIVTSNLNLQEFELLYFEGLSLIDNKIVVTEEM
jgi:hypothetical protein